jgi:hypothetical protein
VVLPNFLIIGAGKSGTTSLYRYLAQHPEVYMSPAKEPSYFKQPQGLRGRERMHVRTLEEYAALFEGATDEKAIGEATPAYLTSADAARRIREAIPEARLIAILRQPADRAFSAYAMWISEGYERLTFADAIAAEIRGPDDSQRRYVQYGFYARQLAPYYDLFDAEQIRVVFFDDLTSDPLELVRGLYDFLGVSTSFVPDTQRRHNTRSAPPKRPALNRFLSRPAMKKLRRYVPSGARHAAGSFAREGSDEALTIAPDERRFLTDLFRDDIAELEQLTGRDLSAWLAD